MNKGHCFTVEDGSIFWILNVYNITSYSDTSSEFTRLSEFSKGYIPEFHMGVQGLSFSIYFNFLPCFLQMFLKVYLCAWTLNKASIVGTKKRVEVNQGIDRDVKLELVWCSLYFQDTLTALKLQKMLFNFCFVAIHTKGIIKTTEYKQHI